MNAGIALALVLHNHQPVGNFGWVVEEVYHQAYEPMIGALERHPTIRMGLHYSGPVLDWLRQERPETLERIQTLVTRGQVETLCGGYYEPVLASLPDADWAGQLLRMANELEVLFGERPHGAWLAERVWEPSLARDLARAGYQYTVLDDNHLRAAAVRDDAMWGTFTTDDQGELLTVFGTEQGLRYRIPFGEVEDVIGYLRQHATESGDRLGTMGDDGEKFGAWPGTFEHCWGKTAWVDHCFSAIEANADWLATVTPREWMTRHQPIGRIAVPATSYVEMTEWALPSDEANVFHEALATARRDRLPAARFLQGASWRNFQVRYREINDLHKQMLRTSRAVATMAPGPMHDRALEHLYQGQSNDCYWHGLFGGVYIVHMRMATLGHLIAAEDLARTAEASRAATGAVIPGNNSTLGETRLVDLDLDGHDEVLISTAGQVVTVDLEEGAGLGNWDLRASRIALASVMRRRPEAYHETLREHARRRAAAATAPDRARSRGEAGVVAEKPATIHDTVRVKEPGLEELLVYDWHERRSGLIHLMPRDVEVADLRPLRYPEWGDFADQPFQVERLGPGGSLVVRREGALFVAGGPHPLRIAKEIRTGGDRLAPSLEVAVEVESAASGAVDCDLGIEWGINLMGGGGNPAAWYAVGGVGDQRQPMRLPHDGSGDVTGIRDGADDREGSSLAFGNDDVGLQVNVVTSPRGRASWFPIETVSNSEAGFERVYQGSALLFRWRLELGPGDKASFSVRFDVIQERDLAAEEAAPEVALRGAA
ncbi:MAG: alpha-amylase/4-alpha-glucanotransferase domain-containing protein [Candidatus Limnocylindrales bacterium]